MTNTECGTPSDPPAPRFSLRARSIGPLERFFAGLKDTSRDCRAVVRDVDFDPVRDEPNETLDFFAFSAKRPQTCGLVVYHVGQLGFFVTGAAT